MEIDVSSILADFEKYLLIHSPAGYTKNAISELENDFKDIGLSLKYTNKGGLIAELKGEDDSKKRVVSAHMDTLGGMVKQIKPNGRLKYHKIGGGSFSAVEGENCYVITRGEKLIRASIVPSIASTHIYGQEKASGLRDGENMEIRLDERVSNIDDVKNLGISVGDFIALDTRLEVTETGFIKSRYIDNKLAVAIVLEICRYFKAMNLTPSYTTQFYISNYEEVGHGIAMLDSDVFEMVAVDVGIVGEGQESDEYSVSICAKDKKTPYDFYFRNRLVDLCAANDIDYKVDVFNFYSSDSTQAIHQGQDINFATLGPAIDASHHYERTHIDSLINTTKLLIKYLMN